MDQIVLSGGCDDTLAAMRNGRVKALLYPPSRRLEGGDATNDDLSSYDYDLIVIGGGSGGLACSKVLLRFAPHLRSIVLFV